MNKRFNLNNNLLEKPYLNHGGLQSRLYNNILWGQYNNEGIKISKLELNIRTLFPLDFEYWNIELVRIRNFIKSERSTMFELELNITWWYFENDIAFICYRHDFNVPLMNLPRLTKNGILIINNTKKILVMQLIKQSAVSFDQESESISLKDKYLDYLKINKSKIKHNTRESDLLASLLKLKTKHSHIFKNTYGTKEVMFYKGKWCYLTWSNCYQNKFKYNSKWSLRLKKTIITYLEIGNNIIVNGHSNRSENQFVNIGEKMVLNKNSVLTYSSSLTITKSNKIFHIINEIIEAKLRDKSEITYEDIDDVELTLPGRIFLNDLTNDSSNYGLELLTKRDLILIWKEISINRSNFKHVDCNVRVVKGSGDMIIDLVKKTLERELCVNDTNDPPDDVMMINIFLGCMKQIQKNIDKFFISSNLCQYLDQVNSLSELSHKGKLTCFGEGGVTQQNVEITIRDTKKWQLAKICPIESPEGQNIGLVLTLSTYANVDVNGYILTGYYKTCNGLINNRVIYLNHFEEKRLNVALSWDKFQKELVTCLTGNKIKIINNNKVDLNLVSNSQVFSPAVCLIPFLGHNDPTRALMAANMLKQAIPPLNPRPPLVGTGEEINVMRDTGHNIVASNYGVVVSLDSKRVVVYEPKDRKRRVYILPQSGTSNQEMYQRMRTVVNFGQILKQGDVIAECQSSYDGEMSLGANLLVAFMCWEGYNFEDSVIISDNIISKGIFKSFHITELETKIMKTPFGNELLSSDIIELPIKYRRYLDLNGIVKVGSNVREGDVLVGKLAPRSDAQRKKEEFKEICGDELSSDEENDVIDGKDGVIEEKMKVIDGINDIAEEKEYGDKVSMDLVYSTSLRVPSGIECATVLEIERSSNGEWSYQNKDLEDYIYCRNVVTRKYIRRCCLLLQVSNIESPNVTCSFLSENKVVQDGLNLLYKKYLDYLNKLEAVMLSKLTNRLTDETQDADSKVLEIIKIKLLVRKSIKIGDKICGRHGNKGVISRIVPKEDMPFMADGTPIDIILNPLGVPSRMNIGQLLEVSFGLISYKFGLEFKNVLNMFYKTNDERILRMVIPKLTEIYPNINNLTTNMILVLLTELSQGVKISCPLFNVSFETYLKDFNRRLLINSTRKVQLYNGITGLPFDRPTSVGIIYIYKLNHLVDNKLHARSTGSYSIVTQQPLKGKNNLGGQRLGEMEVWALQSYGVARCLNESLTAKCDDIVARREIQESILKGYSRYTPHQIEGMAVLVRELFSMCIEIEVTK
ncbi:DNA-directed RNA polymerase subunit beta [Candidatus Hodgkinia cicadicola]|uniref:DNA-directed RNA polymerase subunit beta n=1 Tax=Candidatus Hodgkinia cicadicola TaxID=573658 RepID=A0ABX4MH83_9HYPH|nr:DNA-directed RNA polymerase subunit beta [Candidatus Hodgkinia cicadicola]